MEEYKIKEAIEKTKTMGEAAKFLNMNFNTFKRKAKKLGIYKPSENRGRFTNQKQRKKVFCNMCLENELLATNITGYCKLCYHKSEDNKKLKKWLETGKTPYQKGTHIRGVIRKYIYDAQDNKCAICDMNNMWNGKELNFVLDHIDGDASNDNRENLRLICHNCDSQLETYKSRNKNSARKR